MRPRFRARKTNSTLVLNKLRCPALFQIFSQSDYLVQIVDINSHSEWQTVQIQISWLLRSQLIWIYTVCKGSVYPGSAGLELSPPVVFLLTVPRRVPQLYSSLFVRRWVHRWHLFCQYLFLISLSSGALGRLLHDGGISWVASLMLLLPGQRNSIYRGML